MAKLWVRLIIKNKIWRQDTEPLQGAEPTLANSKEALDEVLKRLDEPRPIWMPSHERQFLGYGQARFLPEHFVERVNFERMELETIE
ncbi:MAG: hypothetical protein LBD16_05520 [Oscillospiraceae bacterium]|jgi:hypothetical protein|nr:hypothetical protein [Oscillospiraceae bacterium]